MDQVSSRNLPFLKHSKIQSFNLYTTYLWQEVFSNMSVLPLVIPSSISCFSGGSWPGGVICQFLLPRRSGVLARSEDNLTGKESTCTTLSLHVLLIIGLNPPDSIPRSSAILSRHSLYTWLHKELEEDGMASSRVGRSSQTNKDHMKRCQ